VIVSEREREIAEKRTAKFLQVNLGFVCLMVGLDLVIH